MLDNYEPGMLTTRTPADSGYRLTCSKGHSWCEHVEAGTPPEKATLFGGKLWCQQCALEFLASNIGQVTIHSD